jgi:transcriptional regulator GlxA family with amidase domain
MFGNVGEPLRVLLVAERAGEVASSAGPKAVAEHGFVDCPRLDLILVPGGIGTLHELENETLLAWLRKRSAEAEITASVCSGSAILARAGLLDGHRATSNKQFFGLATAQSDAVDWVWEARWVDDGAVVTSSGVSAGIDMSLALIERLFGGAEAERIAALTEDEWHREASRDPFAKLLA